MAYDFGNLNMSAVRTSNFLKPWNIYEVTFDGIEREEMKGKDGTTYDTLKITFSNSEGSFRKNLFIPNKKSDFVQGEWTNKEGHKSTRPSNWEEFKWKTLQMIQVLAPKGMEMVQKNAPKFNSPEDYIKLMTMILEKVKGVKTKIKLTGRNSGGTIYADIPNVAAINHSGDLFICNTFIGDSVAWSSYEAGQKSLYESAKPTNMDSNVGNLNSVDTKLVDNTEDTSDIDFEGLAATL